MKKYINGKLYEMTEEDKLKIRERFNNLRKRDDVSAYERRIKELENAVEQLLSKIEESEKQTEV